MNTVTINIIDPVESIASAKDASIFSSALRYPKVFYKKKVYANERIGKERIDYTGTAFSFNKGQNWRFWTGLIPRIRRYLEANGVPLKIQGEAYWNDFQPNDPYIEGETLRDDQIKFILTCIKKTRGTIIAPTAYGKTFLQLGIASCLPSENILIMADKKVIVNQTYQEFINHGYNNVQCITGDSQYKGKFKRIVIGTRQSIKKINIPPDYFSVVMIDEVHHLSSFNCDYAKILQKLLAPFRLGFTGTYPGEDKPEHQLAIESF
ncbi:hypothetical protein LCGC14_2488730, partial [marine sediment metagenome]